MILSPETKHAATASYPSTSQLFGPGTPSWHHYQMMKKWQLTESLRGGTEAMRDKGKEYLPQEAKESDVAYQNRLKRTFLFNLYWRTITSVVGLAYIKDIVISGIPDELAYLERDFDGTGRSVTQIAYDLTIDTIHYGLGHCLVDFPSVETNDLSLAEWRNAGYRPYVSVINPTNLIGWRESSEPGSHFLENVRVIESKLVPTEKNEWEEKFVYYVRIFYPDYTEVYQYDPENPSSGYVEIGGSKNSLGYVPLLTSYANKEGFMVASPALYDLAQVNLCHYQSSSDQRNILHVARVPFIFAKGFEEGELDNGSIGGNTMVVTSNVEADMKHVEHSGQAIEAGRKDILDLENQMAVLGADLLLGKGVSRQTATARKIDQTESMSVLQMALRSVEQLIENAFNIAGEWIGVDASEVSVSIGDDMSIANEPNPTNALLALLDAVDSSGNRLFTDEQIVELGKSKGIFPSHFKLDPNRPIREQMTEIVERDVQTTVEQTSEEPSSGESEEENVD